MTPEELAEKLKRRYEAAPEGYKMLELHLFGIEHANDLTDDIDALAQQGTGHASLGSEIRKGIRLAEHVTLSPDIAREGYLAMRYVVLPFLKCQECEGGAQLWIIEGGLDHIVCTSCLFASSVGHNVRRVIGQCMSYLSEIRYNELIRDWNAQRVNPIEEPLDEPAHPDIEGFKVDAEFAAVIYEIR